MDSYFKRDCHCNDAFLFFKTIETDKSMIIFSVINMFKEQYCRKCQISIYICTFGNVSFVFVVHIF